jgi:hypothetical protein
MAGGLSSHSLGVTGEGGDFGLDLYSGISESGDHFAQLGSLLVCAGYRIDDDDRLHIL